MSTIATVLDFEGNTETIFAQILTDLGLPAYASDTNGDLPIPRVDVVATLTQAGPHEAALPNGVRVYDQQQLAVSITYVFAPDSPNLTETIKYFRGAMRRLTFFYQPILDAFAAQGYYAAAADSIRETGSARQVQTDENAIALEVTVPLVIFLTTSAKTILGPA